MCERVEATKAQVFIIESLRPEDVRAKRRDGKMLYDSLKLQGKKPIYKYVEHPHELDETFEEFYKSGYRYLHLSCHGGTDGIELGGSSFDFDEFDFLDGYLHQRRLFVSGCELGNTNFAECIFRENKDLYSLVAPIKSINFDTSLVFFSSMYYLLYKCNSRAIKRDSLSLVLERICETYGTPVKYFCYKEEIKERKFSLRTWHRELKKLNPKRKRTSSAS